MTPLPRTRIKKRTTKNTRIGSKKRRKDWTKSRRKLKGWMLKSKRSGKTIIRLWINIGSRNINSIS